MPPLCTSTVPVPQTPLLTAPAAPVLATVDPEVASVISVPERTRVPPL